MAKDKEKSKNWFAKHKVWTAIIVLFVLGFIISAAGDSNKSSSGGKATNSAAKGYKFTDRADKQSTDVEIVMGENATIDGVKMTPVSAERKASLSEYETAASGKQYLVVNVQLENTAKDTKPYNVFNFKVQTVSGQVIDAGFQSAGNPINSGDLVAGGKVAGSVVFEVPVETGHQYMIWKPGAWKADRAIVQL